MTLEGISLQTYQNIETIIVCQGLERSAQRNIGIAKSKGKYIFSLDDDHLILPTLISQAVSYLERNPDITFLCFNNRMLNSKNLLQQVRRIEREIALSGYHHIAGCFFFRNILPNKPFNEDLYAGEDYDLHSRLIALGYKFAILNKDTHTYHLKEPTKLSQIVRQSLYYGKGIKSYIRPVEKTQITKVERTLSINPLRITYLFNISLFTPKQFIYFLIYQYTRYTSALIGLLKS